MSQRRAEWLWVAGSVLAALMSTAGLLPALAADLSYGRPRVYVAPANRPPPPPLVTPDDSDLLFTPAEGAVRVVVPYFQTPILPGSSTLPGYYGTSHSYMYQGPYYGGPYVPYWDRLPYACGVYGYC